MSIPSFWTSNAWDLPLRPQRSSCSVAQDPEELCLGQRFFVYELPEKFYAGTFECLQGQWGTEVLLHQYFRRNCNTADPEEADWFYVPLHATCLYVKLNENVSEDSIFNMDSISNEYLWEPMMEFLRGSKYFHRHEGADHIFLFADGQGPRIWDSTSPSSANIDLIMELAKD